MQISVIIPVYKALDKLELIFQALQKQSYLKFEIVIAEDSDDKDTVNFLIKKKKETNLRVKHVYQEDKGFRKNRALNAAIRISEGEFIVFLDGDCIPHTHFLKEYIKNQEEKAILFGRRVMVSDSLTKKILSSPTLPTISIFSLLRHKSSRIEDGIYFPFSIFPAKNNRGIWGCNWGILKKHLVAVNGFDEDYIKAGAGEDVDIEWRLKKIGCRMKSMNHKAIVYHLHHKSNYIEADVLSNLALLAEKEEVGLAYCLNGLMK